MARPVASTIGGNLVIFDGEAVLAIRALPPNMQLVLGDAPHCFVDLPHGQMYMVEEWPEAIAARVWPGEEPD